MLVAQHKLSGNVKTTEIQNLDGILDGIGDFGRMENEILDSMFVQSLRMSVKIASSADTALCYSAWAHNYWLYV